MELPLDDEEPPSPADRQSGKVPARPWLNRTVLGIVTATFLSDLGHEMATAVLPLFLANLGHGAAALGLIEGIANFLIGFSKLGGGVLGHYVERKRPWTAVGYVITAAATAAIGLVRGANSAAVLRCIAWMGRGYRGPLRDFMLADAVEKTHYGRAYGLERAGDMLGAVGGPLVAALALSLAISPSSVIVWTIFPGTLAAAAMFFLVRERPTPSGDNVREQRQRPAFPRRYWGFLAAVFLFGMGDFSRTFLVWFAATWLKTAGWESSGAFAVSVLLYAGHNLISAAAAYPLGHLGDRWPKLWLLAAGYALGVLTNGSLAIGAGAGTLLLAAILMSGVYIAAEETLEKAVAAEFLPREARSMGLGLLAGVNAAGDMASSIYIGLLIDAGRPELAFGIAAALGAAGTLGIAWMARAKK